MDKVYEWTRFSNRQDLRDKAYATRLTPQGLRIVKFYEWTNFTNGQGITYTGQELRTDKFEIITRDMRE